MAEDAQRSTPNTQYSVGDWVYIPSHHTHGRIIERSVLWGHEILRVWVPISDTIIRVRVDEVSTQSSMLNPQHLTFVASAARIADALTQDVLLAPIESSVIPLPHQIRALSRAMSGDRVRYLLADEVGLGKTIEAGLIMRELKLRGLVRRTLVVTPKGLVSQWVAEMAMHFNEQFHPILSEDYRSLKRILAIQSDALRGLRNEYQQTEVAPSTESPAIRSASVNPFRVVDQVIVSMDSVKPPSNKHGEAWERFEDLISAGWDLVIVDEAHRLGGSTDQVARYKLGQGLAEAAPYLLLLSATPHQGKTDAFHRLISLLDPQAFPDVSSVTRDRVQPYVIRTEKRRAIDAEGKPLFKPRHTELVQVPWEDHHRDQRMLYEAVTEYVRKGYNQAIAEKRNYIGFLMILMQRLVASSTRAIRTTLERRLEILNSELRVSSLFDEQGMLNQEPETIYDLDGEELRQLLLRTKGLQNEREEVTILLEAARRCESQGPDVKAKALLDWIYRLQAEEGDPDLKVLVFTDFVPTQEMLYEFLTDRGFKVVCLNGSMNMEERKRAQEAFARDARILISTDAGGEGLNLQFCHVVINYDIPWNPMRLEQRIGRVDRIGQNHTVRAINFVLEDSVEHRVLEVLEKKLAVIFEELGIDKTGDVLDSAQAEKIFDDLYVEAILNPDGVETKVDEVVQSIQEQARESRKNASLLGSAGDLDPREAQRLLAHPLPHWVERMTVSYLKAHGGKVERKNGIWNLTWPDGERLTNVVFTSKEAEEKPLNHHLTLEDSRVRGLAMRLIPFAPGQPVPVIMLPGLAPEIRGFWSLWRISISTTDWNRHRIMPLFLSDEGRVFAPTARHIWDQLLVTEPTILRHLDIETSHQAFERLREAAEQQGKMIYDELVQAHQRYLAREREKGEYAFAARRRAIERIGLPQVRNHRLRILEQEEERFYEQLKRRAQVLPEMMPLILVRVEGGAHE
ncbi:MAG: DEAD/DEAH box helicase family protein [Deltaproteobacteria bacterium]|nr:DEAD/DEAH box helicase family protein [Deltaproteobacteria bacterium]